MSSRDSLVQLGLVVTLLVGCSQAVGDEAVADGGASADSSSPGIGEFSVLTYNIHGLPQAITGDDTPARLKEIGPKLNDFELVGLQEDWIKSNWSSLDVAAKHAHRSRFSAVKSVADGEVPKVYGAGLTAYSAFDIALSEPSHFEKCHGYADNAGDCLASKGFQLLRLQVGGRFVDFYNTHMEAGGSELDDAARVEHTATLLAKIESFSAGRAVIFVGDTNLRKKHKDGTINALESKLLQDFEAVLTDSCTATGCADPTHIDRIFFRSGDDLQLKALSWQDLSASFLDAAGEDLSDHPPLSARLQWQHK